MLRLLFAGTIFSSAFLLFLVQPIISKQILPWFGGSAAVWATCMVFFQVTLLAGYAYADAVARFLKPSRQALLHVALLLASLAFLPIVPDESWKPAGTEDPAWRIIGLLLATIGLPYFLLSTTGPLVQSWVSRTIADARVYRYFSLSNLASLAALMAYPFVVEPYATLRDQAGGWSIVYVLFAASCAASALAFRRRARMADAAVPAASPLQPSKADARAPGSAPTARDIATWLALSAMGSWLLLAITNHMTQEIASIPFLWLLPLVVYLLTFVLAFESDRWYSRRRFLAPAGALLLLCAWGLQSSFRQYPRAAIALYAVGLFAFCMFCHGELARMRPPPRYLTRFYLALSAGGALGGIAVGIVAPRVLPAYYEAGIGFIAAALLAWLVLRERRSWRFAAAAVALGCGYFMWAQVSADLDGTRVMQRNFYGTLLSVDVRRDDPADDVRQLYHGSIKHGEQYLVPARRDEPTTYYGSTSGIGRAILRDDAPNRRVGLIGLGAGTLAAYGRPGDVYRFYEINPAVIDIAREEFSFIRDSRARIETALGDARLSLEREEPQRFDVLAVDAFTGDSIPVHLITREALAAYLRHVKDDGIVAFHVTNHFLSLAPVVEKVAAANGAHAVLIRDEAENSPLRKTDWVLVARRPELLSEAALGTAPARIEPIEGLRVWTDDFNNLFQVLK